MEQYQNVNSAVQEKSGDMFDCAVNDYKMAGEDFINMFIVSDVSKRIEKKDPYILGKSGIELFCEVVFETSGKTVDIVRREKYSRSVEYWIGWAVAGYQLKSRRSYIDIFGAVTFQELKNMYILHEADSSKFFFVMDERIKKTCPNTNLKRKRTALGFSQKELSALSGVGLRSIQMYEQRKKNINKASADTVYNLALALCCDVEELLEI